MSRSPSDRRGRAGRLRVAVLMGGPSSEHDISLDGGANVVSALVASGFDVRPVVITREGAWRIAPRAWKPARDGFDPRASNAWKEHPGTLEALVELKTWPPDAVVPILHGHFGEDGTVQACLSAAGLAFVGSGSCASALANDKVHTKEVLLCHGIRTPRYEVLSGADVKRGHARTAGRLVEEYGLPLVLKEPCGGSSIEVKIPEDENAVAVALGSLAESASRLLVEAHVAGRELTAGILEDRDRGEAVALPIVEIRPRRGKGFSFIEKYSVDGAEELCPAPIPEEVEAAARSLGLRVHEILGLRGISRTDLILDPAGDLWVLEVNTLPGMTERGLVPLAARAIGLDFETFVEGLVRTAAVV